MRARARFLPEMGIICSTLTIWSVKALGAISTKRCTRDSALIFGSSHAAACGTRAFAAFHFLSASLMAGLSARTARVTWPNERLDDGIISAAHSVRNDKVVNNKNKRVVFIDP